MNDCKDWLSVCGAECCKQFVLKLPKSHNAADFKRGSKVSVFKICTQDKIRYYKIHGCRYEHGILSFELEDFEVCGHELTVFKRCDYLNSELECEAHGTFKQPTVCHKPNKYEHENIEGVKITEKCKYATQPKKEG